MGPGGQAVADPLSSSGCHDPNSWQLLFHHRRRLLLRLLLLYITHYCVRYYTADAN